MRNVNKKQIVTMASEILLSAVQALEGSATTTARSKQSKLVLLNDATARHSVSEGQQVFICHSPLARIHADSEKILFVSNL